MVLENFDVNLQKYAKLLVSTGINVQPGHTVVIYAEVEQAVFARLLVKEAYQLGASEVIVNGVMMKSTVSVYYMQRKIVLRQFLNIKSKKCIIY